MDGRTDFIKEAKNCVTYAYNLLDTINYKDEQERQIFGAFSFGIINGLAYEMKENPIKVQGIMIEILINVLKYMPNQASEFCQLLIDSTDRVSNPTIFAIIHRGMDGYYQMQNKEVQEFKNNFNEIVALIKAEGNN